MDNIKEIKEITRSNIDYKTRNSEVREKYRYLNSSHRNGKSGFSNYRTRENKDYISDESAEELKIARDFRRFVISTAIVGLVVGVKIVDTNFTNMIENKITASIRTSSTLEESIQGKMVYFASKVGINIDGVNADNKPVVEENNVASEEPEVVLEEVKPAGDSDDSATEVFESQVEDFYIDESILEEVMEDEKK